jgi:prepilin-type processing-associated H-X9-DG protein
MPISGHGWSSYVMNAKVGGSNATNSDNGAKPGFCHLLCKGATDVYLAFDGQASWVSGTDRVADPVAAGSYCERSDAICPIATTPGEIVPNRGIAAFRHGGQRPANASLNMLYCDGHVAVLTRQAMPSKLNNVLTDIGNQRRTSVDSNPPWFPIDKNSASPAW